MDSGAADLKNLTKNLNKLVLTTAQIEEKAQKEYYAEVNHKSKRQFLDEYGVPESLRYHIPRSADKYQRLSEHARKEKRSSFTLHKALPGPLSLDLSKKNRKVARSISTLAQHLQSNSKHALGGLIEVATDIHTLQQAQNFTTQQQIEIIEFSVPM